MLNPTIQEGEALELDIKEMSLSLIIIGALLSNGQSTFLMNEILNAEPEVRGMSSVLIMTVSHSDDRFTCEVRV